MLNFSKPTQVTGIVTGGSLLISIGILYLANPSWLQKIDKGKVVRSWPLIISYSITFAFVCGVITLLISSQKRKENKDNTFCKPPASSSPSTENALAYASSV